MPTNLPHYHPGTPGTMLFGGLPIPTGGGLITTLSLVNTSGSTQAANFVSPMLGMPFAAGDLPSGEWPVFALEDDTPCPATVYNDTSWPDGSKRLCGVFFRTPTSIAGSASLTINVNSGGSAPSASSRTLSDVTAADLKVEVTGVTNLSGLWTASLNTAITDATEILVIGDGPAGKLYRVRGAFKQSGAAHGQLECYHYFLLAQNSAGGLSHIEYLPRVAQLWADVASPTPTRRVMTCVMKSGATTLLTMQGHDTTETPGANIGLNHYSSFFVADTDGRFTFVQGGGTTSSRPTVRVVRDKPGYVKPKMVPSYDLTETPTSSSSVDYRAMGRGPMQRNMAGTGERPDIGILPTWAARQILTQAAVDERVVRVAAMCSSGWRGSVRRASTGQIIPLNTGTYTGMGSPLTTAQYRPGVAVGVNAPTVETSLWNSEYEPSHRPSAVYPALILTGEPQFYDLLEEQANGLTLSFSPGTPNTFATAPITGSAFASGSSERNYRVGSTDYYCCATLAGSNLARLAAWTTRDWVHLLAVLPDTAPDGVARKAYAQDVVDDSFDMINAYNANQSAGWQAGGFYYFRGTDQPSETGWTMGYMACAVATACGVLGNPTNAVTFRDYIAKFFRGMHDRYDIAAVATFSLRSRDENNVRVEDLDNMMCDVANGSMSWNATTNVFTVGSGGSGNFNYTPTNGDKHGFSSYFSANKPFTSTPDRQIYHVVEASGQNFKLAATAGGSSLDVNTTSSVDRMWAAVANFSPRYAFQGNASTSSDGYLANTRGAMRLLEATGNTNVNPARVAQDANWVATTGTFTSDPKNAFAPAYPA